MSDPNDRVFLLSAASEASHKVSREQRDGLVQVLITLRTGLDRIGRTEVLAKEEVEQRMKERRDDLYTEALEYALDMGLNITREDLKEALAAV